MILIRQFGVLPLAALFVISIATPQAQARVLFPNFDRADIFTEETILAQAKTMAAFLQARLGRQVSAETWEAYAVIRMGGDSRTFLDPSDRVYNDNYAFFGAGIDYLRLFSGVRITLQLGGTTDLNSKIHLGGPDGRLGFATNHEWSLPKYAWLHGEIASEAFYTRRYRNILSNFQLRNFIDLARIRVMKDAYVEIAPALIIMATLDSAGYDYNRIFELRFGIRARLQGLTTIMLGPYFVIGKRWQEPTKFPNYTDSRLIVTLSTHI